MPKKILGLVACYEIETKEIVTFPVHRDSTINQFLEGMIMTEDTHEVKARSRVIIGFYKTNELPQAGKCEDKELVNWFLKMEELKNKIFK